MRHTSALSMTLLLLGIAIAHAQDNPRPAPRRAAAEPFQQMFRLPDVDFTESQLAEVAKLREQFVPKLEENQRQWNAIVTDEQQRARREAFQQARDAGKAGQALRDAVNAAIQLSDEQKAEQTKLLGQRNQLAADVRSKLLELLTDEQRTQVRLPQRVQQQKPPTQANVKYGPHERNVMDLWLADSDKPTPILVSIHGGGFLGGDKSVSPQLLEQCLDSGISVAAITYRFSSQAIAPASFHDSARAVQFIRHHAKQWNINPAKVAATGGSAGAGISLWLGFHDDLADPNSDDPVLRESTRLSCMMVVGGQTTYDPRAIRKLFPESDTYKHGALARLYDVDLEQLDNLPEAKYQLFEECSPIAHLTKDDPPAMLSYSAPLDQPITDVGIGIHHARFGKLLKDKMDALELRCLVYAGNQVLGDDERISPVEFMKQEFSRDK